MLEGIRRWSSRLGGTPPFAPRSIDAEGGGRILILDGQPGLKPGSLAASLRAHGEGRLPFVALLIDFHGADYRFSSDDLGSLLSAIAAWMGSGVAPCALVLTSSAASEVQQLLDLCKVNTIESLRIVGSADAALDHIRLHLERGRASSGG